MVTYKAAMRPALEYASSIWPHLSSSTSINKPQVMQNAALRTATECTQDTNIHVCMKHSYFLYTSTYSSTHHNTNKKHNIHHTPYTTYNLLQHSKAKKTIFNNGHYTTNIPTDPHTNTITDIKTNMYHNIHLLSPGIQPQEAVTKYCADLHHTLAALKIYFPSPPHSLHPCPTQHK